MSGNPNPLIYSHHSLSVQLCASMHSIMIDTTLRRASGKSGIHGSVSGLYTPGALSCKWLLLYSKNPAFKNDSSWASEREGCILNISALQGHHPCFLSTTSKRHSSRASISIAEHCVLCLWSFHIALRLMVCICVNDSGLHRLGKKQMICKPGYVLLHIIPNH